MPEPVIKPRSFLVTLCCHNESDGYVADVPELPGCMSQGKTIEQARKNIREAIALCLEANPRNRRMLARSPLVTTVEV
jgi:predicted RNase H-like HicB family nuclease